MKKKFRLPAALITSLLLTFGLAAGPVSAASAPKIEEIDYDGGGKVEVEFYGNISYHNSSVTVKDANGKSYRARIIKRDDDDIKFQIYNYKKGMKYRFTIRGIARQGSSNYTSVSGKVKIPSAKVAVKEIDYDSEDKTVEIDFKDKVKWDAPTVSIMDSQGTEYSINILEKDNDSIEVSVNALTIGETYSYTVTGVNSLGQSGSRTLTGTFVAKDRD